MKHSKSYIYCLIDPFTNQVRYIGQTVEPEVRLKSHVWYAKNKRRHRKDMWIWSVLQKGGYPIMDLLYESEIEKVNFWEEHYIFLYKSWGFELVNHSLFPSLCGISYNKRPRHSEAMKFKFLNDPIYALKHKSMLAEMRLDKDFREKQIRNSQKSIMQPECLARRAKSLRGNYERLFYVYKNGVYIGGWLNNVTCSKDLGLNQSGIARCLIGIRGKLYEYTFRYAEDVHPNYGGLVKIMEEVDELGNITESKWYNSKILKVA